MALYNYDPKQGNIGLLDALGTCEIFHSLSTRFYAVEFIDLCTVAEEIVLRDKILIAGKWQLIPKNKKRSIEVFVNAGVFVPISEPFKTIQPPIQSENYTDSFQNMIQNEVTNTSLKNTLYESSRILGAEEHYNSAGIPLLRQGQYYGIMRKAPFEHTFCDLVSNVRHSNELVNQIRVRYKAKTNMPSVTIPPIALTAIMRSRNFEEVCNRILELRDEFSYLRKKFNEIEEILRDPTYSPEKKYIAETNWMKQWNNLNQDITVPNQISIPKTAHPFLKNAAKVTKVLYKGSKGDFDEAVETAREIFSDIYTNQHLLRPVHMSVRNYLKTSDNRMKESVSNIFERDLAKINKEIRLLASPKSPWYQFFYDQRLRSKL